MKATVTTIFVSILLAISAGCSSMSDGILDEDDMADLLVDMNIGECVVEMNPRDFANDSLKKVLRQSILADHRLTSADYDRNIEWYGRHMDKYQEVYEEVIRRLEKRIAEEKLKGSTSDNALAEPTRHSGQSSMTTTSLEGDSVDIWNQPRVYTFSSRISSEYVTFTAPRDANFRDGDVFTWQFKLANQGQPVKWGLFATYADNSTDMVVSDGLNIFAPASGDSNLQKCILRTAKNKVLKSVFGFIRVRSSDNNIVKIGDISLVRTRYSESDNNMNDSEIRQINESDGSVTLRFDDSNGNNPDAKSPQNVESDKNIDRREQQSRLEDERRMRSMDNQDNRGNQHEIDPSRAPLPLRPHNTNMPYERVNGNHPQQHNANSQPMTRSEAKHYKSKKLSRNE